MTLIQVKADNPKLRVLGRMDRSRWPLALDWTGSGVELQFKGSDLWAELEAPAKEPIMWMMVLTDGKPVARFPVEPGVRFYPLVLGMDPEHSRTVTLMKETQCMPDSPEATVLIRTLRMNGEAEELKPRDLKIEFIGDSLTSGEGSLAPRDNDEWITIWFSACGNYSQVACQELNAERRILSQSGYGVCWNWEHKPEQNMTDSYEAIAGVMKGEAAEKRGCGLPNDFSAWQPDIVCIRLLTNDGVGTRDRDSFAADRETLKAGCRTLLRKVRKNNPKAKIVWILPGTEFHPELAEEAVQEARQEGMTDLFTFALPDYGGEDMGARFHPNAGWNRKAGIMLAEYLKKVISD